MNDSSGSLVRWCFGLGCVLALLGGLAIAAPWVASKIIATICGIALVAAGISQIGMAAGTWTWRGFWLSLACGVLSLVAGTALIAIPVEGVHVLVTFLGIVVLFEAAAKLAAAFSLPRDLPWGWLFADGLVTALLGGILLVSPAAQSGVLLGILVGINLLSSGLALVMSGLWIRRATG